MEPMTQVEINPKTIKQLCKELNLTPLAARKRLEALRRQQGLKQVVESQISGNHPSC